MPPGYGADDQTGLLFADGELSEVFTAREGAGVWKVTRGEEGGVEEPVEAKDIRPKKEAGPDGSPIDDLRALNLYRRSVRLR